MLYLQNLAHELEHDSTASEQWPDFPQNVLHQDSNIIFTGFIDEENKIQAISTPNIEEKTTIDVENIIQEHFYPITSREPHAEWLKSNDEKHILLVNFPVDGKYSKGMLLAAIDMDSELRMINNYLSDYAFLLKNDKGEVVYSYNAPKVQTFDSSSVFNYKLTVGDNSKQQWSIELLHKNTDIYSHSFMVIDWMLVFGLLVSLLLSLLLFFFLKSLEAVKNAKLGNNQLVRTNVELENQRKKAQKASRAKTEFLSNMSHEIRTPLNAILGLCELLRTDRSTAQKNSYLLMMQESSKTLLGLVNDVLAIDRIESGNENLARDRFAAIRYYRKSNCLLSSSDRR